jgi:hypothetical protein
MNQPSKDGPKPLDFSEAAARKAAFSEVIQSPLTLWPPALGIAAGVGLGIFGIVSAPMVATMITGGFVVGGAHWALRYLGGGQAYMQKHYARLHEEFEAMKERKLATLATELKKLGCKQGQAQVTQFEDKFQNLVAVFRRVLSEGELTFDRFVGTAEQVYRSGLDNLDRVVTLLLNVDDMDHEEIESRIAVLAKRLKRTHADDTNLSALRDQAKDYDDTQQEVEELLARNEEALATMDKAGAAAVRIKDRTASQTPQETMAEAMELLAGMIARANTKPGASITLEK